jgi:hypothetical protein
MCKGILPYAKSRLSKFGVFSCFFVKTYGVFRGISFFSKTYGGFKRDSFSIQNLWRYGNGTQVYGFGDQKEEKWRLRIEAFFYKVFAGSRKVACRKPLSEEMDVISRQNIVNFGIDVFFSISFANGGFSIG